MLSGTHDKHLTYKEVVGKVGALLGHMMQYSPFSKPLNEISGDELLVLKTVDEGWFVDYKSKHVKPVDFGKHLSAFANQFGGWLFVGVQEGPNKSLKADSFPGIDTIDVPKVLVQIREGVTAHVSTPIIFAHRVIDGPIPSIGLDKGKSIIIIQVPEGENPPYVHSSGRIYRRVADSSEPKYETDRAVLDAMWQKADRLKTRLEQFILKPISNDPSYSAPGAYSYIYLLHDLTLSDSLCGLSFNEFNEVLTAGRDKMFPIHLDNMFPTQDGFVARQYMGNNNPTLDLLSLRWWRNGNVRLTIPIQKVRYTTRFTVHSSPEYKALCQAMGLSSGNIASKYAYNLDSVLDLGMWSFALTALLLCYLALRDHCGLAGPIHGKVLLSNVGNAIPFIPMKSLVSQLSTSGVPISQDNVILAPVGASPETFLRLEDQHELPAHHRSHLLGLEFTIRTLRAMGVGINEIVPNSDEGKELIMEYMRALKTATDDYLGLSNT